MRPVVETIGGRAVELRLTIDALDQVAAVNPQFGEVLAAFEVGVWDWREVCAILGAALRPHNIPLSALYEDRGIEGCRALAHRVLPDFAAAVAAWNAIQSGDAPDGGELPSQDVVAAKIRSSLGRRRANG